MLLSCLVWILVWLMCDSDVRECIMICFDGIFSEKISIGLFCNIVVFLMRFIVNVVLFIDGCVVMMIKFDGCKLVVFLLRLL